MKIYIPNFMPKNIKGLNDTLCKNIITYNDIYSSEGLFRIQNNNIFQLIPNDISVIYTKYNNTDFIIDKSYYIFNKNIYCIPYNHIIYNIEKTEYKLDNKSKITLIIEKFTKDSIKDNIKDINKDNIKDIYFITKEEILHDYLKINILEYVSLINK
jgi:hypothetical protein